MKNSRTVMLNTVCLTCAVALIIIPLFLNRNAQFTGSDTAAVTAIAELNAGYTPWFSSLWEPPGSEVESLLFTLQACIGAAFIGFYFGRRRGRKEAQNRARD